MIFKKIAISTVTVLSALLFPLESVATEISTEANNLERQESISLKDLETYNYLNTVKNTELENNVRLEFIGSRITAKFSPTNLQGQPIELSKLAAELGYESFNWVSYVEKDPYGIANSKGETLATPYNDPPLGGYQYETADMLPFYWDMTQCDRCNPHHQYRNPHFTKKFELIFEDAPADYRLKAGETVEFLTHLVGVKSYDLQTNRAEWNAIYSFRWQLTNNDAGQGLVSLIEENIDLGRLSPFVLIEMEADGANLPQTISRKSSTQEVISSK